MSNGQNQTRVRRSKSGRRAPPRPTTAKQSPAGLVISVALHAGLLAATFYTWSRMVQMPPEENHAIPVELVTAQQTNVRAEAPPPEEKPIVDKVAMPEPQLPAFLDVEPAPYSAAPATAG